MAKQKLTVKQRKFVKFYLESGNASQAALQAGYKQTMSGRENLLKPTIKNAFQQLLDRAGLTDGYLADNVFKLTKAQKIQSCDILVKKENGKIVVNENSNDFIEVNDNNVQLGATKLALQIKERLNGHNKEEDKILGTVKHEHFFTGVLQKAMELRLGKSYATNDDG